MPEKDPKKSRALAWKNWSQGRATRWLRRFLLSFVVLPGLRLGYSVEVRGIRWFTTIEEPCLIISNHNMHLDQMMLMGAMPAGFRDRIAIAAASTDIFGNRARGFFARLLGNAFPFTKEGSGVRDSLETVARMMEAGWHVLIFPEGLLTVVGPMQPFKSGTAYLAVETGVEVLPMRIDVVKRGFYEGQWFPNPRARVRVTIGRPQRFAAGSDYDDVNTVLEQAVRDA